MMHELAGRLITKKRFLQQNLNIHPFVFFGFNSGATLRKSIPRSALPIGPLQPLERRVLVTK